MKQRKSSISFERDRPGLISTGCGASVCWEGVPEAEDLWNTVSLTLEGRAFAGCILKEIDDFAQRIKN